jgi:NAD(P)-dependent dehydrogenase (short-subunit alcohol dehydrogenase family)
MKDRKKIAIITGAAKGIGKSCVTHFLDQGCEVWAWDIDGDSLDLLSQQFPSIHTQVCDVTQSSSIEKSLEGILQVDYLINNAGIQRYGTAVTTAEGEWDAVMTANVKSAFLCSQKIIPLMEVAGSGVIINVASVQAYISQHNVAAYTSSKSALLGLTRSIAVDFAPSIRCLAVCPGTVDTPMLRQSLAAAQDPAALLEECKQMHLTQEIGDPADIAALIWFLCSDAAKFMTGQSVRIDGGLGITIQGSPR